MGHVATGSRPCPKAVNGPRSRYLWILTSTNKRDGTQPSWVGTAPAAKHLLTTLPMANAVSSKFKEHIIDSSTDDVADDFHFKEEHDESEERQGLLSGRTDTPTRESGGFPGEKSNDAPWSWMKMLAVGAAIVSLLVVSYSGAMYYMRYKSVERAKSMHFDGQMVRSNGTHDFKRTVLIVSIDGLRYVWLF